MKRIISSLVLACALGALTGCPDKTPPPPPAPVTPPAPPMPPEAAKPPPAPPLTEEDKQKALYGFGVLLAQRTPVGQLQLTEAELGDIVKGIEDQVGGKDVAGRVAEVGTKVDQLLKQKSEERAAAEKKKGAEFLTKAAKEKGAVKTASGLVFVSSKEGTGKLPAPTDTVKVNYRGTLIDGTEFDSSYKRNAPAEFPLNGVIKCWTEGVGMMKVGGKAKLVCPSDIAYGERGAPPNIPSNSTLVFEVELLEFKAPAPAPAMPPMPTPTMPTMPSPGGASPH
jgi:FKBP-type peptidyl-prolyl cis-trans isomerase FkpA